MPIDLDDPIALMLAAAAAALERSGAESAVYGRLALGMYGEPRETRDADFAVTSAAAASAAPWRTGTLACPGAGDRQECLSSMELPVLVEGRPCRRDQPSMLGANQLRG
jgi:hypothetical protein